MVYIPKSQIKSNQFTNGNEWYYVKNNASYVGSYFKLSNGKAYTGRSPNNPPNEEITQNTPIVSSQTKNYPFIGETQSVKYMGSWRSKDLKIYGILKKTDYNLSRSNPQYNPTIPLSENFEQGSFIRYFTVRVNQLEFLEINKETYDNILSQNPVWMWENFIPFTLRWYIKGDIERTFNNNKGSLFLTEKNIKRKGLEKYLSNNYLQYFEYSEVNNLTTNGGELITKEGADYVGSYHVNKTQGPMVGAIHTQPRGFVGKEHNPLFYKKFYVSKLVNSLNQEGVIETGETQNIEYRSSISINNSSTGGGY